MNKHQADFGRSPEADRITASKAQLLADKLNQALVMLESRGIRVPMGGRLRAAEKQLRAIELAAQYGDTQAELATAAEAVWLALDFCRIADTLGDELTADLAGQLSIAQKGSLVPVGGARAPYQFQSQFVFGAALKKAGLHPVVPSPLSKAPDFVVCPGTVRFGVEVKRPASRRGVFDLLRAGRDQLDTSNLHGVVVLDLTDCLEDIGLRRFDDPDETFPPEHLKGPYKQFVEEVSETIWNWKSREYRPGYSAIMGVWFLLRGWRWLLGDTSAPHLFEFQGFHRFASASGNVWHHLADEFHRRTLQGMKDSGLYINQAEHESPYRVSRPFWADKSDAHGA